MGKENEERLVQSVGKHLVRKLVSLKGNNDSRQRVQLLRGLSVLCACQGAPIQENQSECILCYKLRYYFVISVLLCIDQILQKLRRAFLNDEEVKSITYNTPNTMYC